MDLAVSYFSHYFPLICLSIVMIENALAHFSANRKISICALAITLSCNILALSSFFQGVLKPVGAYYPVMILSIIGYALRPVCIYLFILMNKKAYNGKWSFLFWIPLIINLAIYLCALIPGTAGYIFGFGVAEDGHLFFVSGPLRFASHIVSAIYFAYLLYISVFTLRKKHFMHGITLLACAAFVIAAVIIETFQNSENEIEILNTTVMVSTVAYYLFLYKENMQIDTLTGTFNRETYYRDLRKMSKTFTAVIQFDIDGLKFINDNYGHHEGDKCISTVAATIKGCLGRSMYAYRMGGDEFLVIVNDADESVVIQTVDTFKEAMKLNKYHCSVGYAMRRGVGTDLEMTMREAEKNMYSLKDFYYKNSTAERRTH